MSDPKSNNIHAPDQQQAAERARKTPAANLHVPTQSTHIVDSGTGAAEPTRPVPRVEPAASPQTPPHKRRDFFGEAVRDILTPLTNILERKITPVIDALEQLPDKAEKLANVNVGAFDQLHTGLVRTFSLQQAHETANGEDEYARFLRPPGAMAPGEFESICSRCGNCVEACPAEAIMLDQNSHTAGGFPYILPLNQPCVVCSELACMKSCPTGALKLVDKLSIRMGTARVRHEKCLRDRGENCTLCIDVCPIEKDGQRAVFASTESGRIRVRKNICIGCGLCESRCPTNPAAIEIVPFKPPSDPIVA